MADDQGHSEEHWPQRVVEKRIEKMGMRPRLAAGVIATLWLVAIVVFGIVEHLVDPGAFDSAWDGMWWATQTVTTVGYGDVVPDEGLGRVIASILMIGGLSLFAVVTGAITSSFVTRAQADAERDATDPIHAKLAELEAQLTAIGADVARLAAAQDRRDP